VLEQPAGGSFEGLSVASSSEDENGLVRLEVLGVKTLALHDAKETCLVMSCDCVDQ